MELHIWGLGEYRIKPLGRTLHKIAPLPKKWNQPPSLKQTHQRPWKAPSDTTFCKKTAPRTIRETTMDRKMVDWFAALPTKRIRVRNIFQKISCPPQDIYCRHCPRNRKPKECLQSRESQAHPYKRGRTTDSRHHFQASSKGVRREDAGRARLPDTKIDPSRSCK